MQATTVSHCDLLNCLFDWPWHGDCSLCPTNHRIRDNGISCIVYLRLACRASASAGVMRATAVSSSMGRSSSRASCSSSRRLPYSSSSWTTSSPSRMTPSPYCPPPGTWPAEAGRGRLQGQILWGQSMQCMMLQACMPYNVCAVYKLSARYALDPEKFILKMTSTCPASQRLPT